MDAVVTPFSVVLVVSDGVESVVPQPIYIKLNTRQIPASKSFL